MDNFIEIEFFLDVVQATPYSHMRNKLLDLIGDEKAKNYVSKNKEIASFTEKLSEQFFRENRDDVSLFIKAIKIVSLEDEALRSLEDCKYYSYFLFFTNFYSFIMKTWPLRFQSDWFNEATKKFSKEKPFFLQLLQMYDPSLIRDHDSKEPDGENLNFGLVEETTRDIVEMLEGQLNVMEVYMKEDEGFLSAHHKYYGKRLFPNVSQKNYLDALISFGHARLARVYSILKQQKKCRKELDKAICLYKDNSLALIQFADLELPAHPTKAQKKYDKVLELITGQFNLIVLNEIKRLIEFDAKLGLANASYLRGLNEDAEEKYEEIINLQLNDPFREGSALLHRGQNRLEKGDFREAENDFKEVAEKFPELAADACVNLGLVYLKQGLYKMAEKKLFEAIEKDSDLPHSYYNLGVLYNEQGQTERAKKLFTTALSKDEAFIEAGIALKRFQTVQVKDIPDIFDWWLGNKVSRIKKGVGISIFGLIGLLMATANYHLFYGIPLSQDFYIVLGILMLLLLLPIVSKLKFGPVELEFKAKVETPLSIGVYPISPFDVDRRPYRSNIAVGSDNIIEVEKQDGGSNVVVSGGIKNKLFGYIFEDMFY